MYIPFDAEPASLIVAENELKPSGASIEEVRAETCAQVLDQLAAVLAIQAAEEDGVRPRGLDLGRESW